MKTVKTAKGTELPLLDLKGKDYLQVAHRILWFREDHPLWSIITEVIRGDDKSTTFKATIITDDGKVLSTAHQTEQLADFRDHLAKAETAAIGRALAMIGYGTQFAVELDEGGRIVDSPVPAPVRPNIQPQVDNTPRPGNAQDGLHVTEKQVKRLFAIAYSKGWNNDEIKDQMHDMFGIGSTSELLVGQYNKLIAHIEANPVVQEPGSNG